MADLQKDFLFVLIKSLSTSEKRQFKLYVNRLGINVDAKFLLLFSEMEKMKEYDEDIIISKKISTKQQLSNLKAHLYKQILVSLRMNPSLQNNRIQLREQLDFATILYQKGLHRQALKILDKAKQTAFDLDEKTLAIDIIDLEKVIESQYITRSIEGRADELIAQSHELSIQNSYSTELSNLSLKLYSEMLKNGYAQNDTDKESIIHQFNEQIRKISFSRLNFREKLWFYKAHVWKHLLLQDYKHAYKYSQKWVELFYENPEMISNHPVWYIKGNTNLMKILFLNGQVNKLEGWFEKFRETTNSGHFTTNENLQSLTFLNVYNTQMNIHFIKGEFFIGTKLIPEVELKMEKFRDKIDDHHLLILYLKIAALYFGSKKYKETIEYGQRILLAKGSSIQEDLAFHTRVLILMAKYESGMDEDYDEFAKQTHRFVAKMKNASEIHFSISEFFQKLNEVFFSEQEKIFTTFYNTLNVYNQNPFHKRTLVYIDIQSWAEAKATHIDVVEIIRQKVKNRKL
ncbi:hypothetical protein BAS09_05845 [Elizabethkingia ursingii]|uniref:hypothetical protein n=1 Tax=Elizabethkingia ursingii TaxID=1756150 RepID=UPI00099A9C76|nr:hypothetical protein [Elizabethkingia ursingii]MCL1666187.1 hypothetical protein [Elizabethkingia ursingii]OPC05197.1 hypothetical protein BAS09_05845 [Elizabethkingia ursingii]